MLCMRWIAVLSAAACGSTIAAVPDRGVEIVTAHSSAEEEQTRQQLERLFERHDLSPWRFTRRVVIDEEAIPHSHPVLTLHTRHLRDDLLLLSTYIHEQSHWYVDRRPRATAAAVAELEAQFPDLPVGHPDGASSRESNYAHLIVIALEWDGLRSLVGELAARQVMEFWASDHYRVLYRTVLAHRSRIRAVLRRHDLGAGQRRVTR
jgi:hypothetical protein